MWRLRAVLGPLAIGVSVWCAAGRLTVVTADAATHRAGALAPWWILAAAAVLALLISPWRRRPALAMPALLATVPWWPVPLPPIALLWTGPLAWAPIIAAIALAVAAPASTLTQRLIHRSGALQAGLATLAIVMVVAGIDAPRSPQGDEPHYLVGAQSLIKDHDFDVRNNFNQRDYAEYFPITIWPVYDHIGRHGAIYSAHPIGPSIVVAPGFALFGYRGAEATYVLLSALVGALVWVIGFRVTGQTDAAWFGWAAIVATPAFLLHSFAIFPEIPGACLVAGAVLWLVTLAEARGRTGVASLLAGSTLLAVMPWMQPRFVVFAGAFGLMAVWLLARGAAGSLGTASGRIAVFAAIPLISACGLFTAAWWMFGVADPRVAVPPLDFQLQRVWRGWFGLAFDEQFGLLPYTPVLAAVAVGAVLAVRRGVALGWLRLAIAAAGAGAVLQAASYRMDEMWWGGPPSAPGRYAVAALPTLAVLLAPAWTRATAAARQAWAALLLLSAAISMAVVVVQRGELGWNFRDAQARWLEWFGPLVNLPRGWPSVFWVFPSIAPFFILAGAWILVWVGLWFVVRGRLGQTGAEATSAPTIVVWWLAVGLMAAIQAGWWLHDVNGLDPARSQFAVLEAARRRGAAVDISAFYMLRTTEVLRAVVIRPEEPLKWPQPTALGRFAGAPPGRYRLRLVLSEARAGSLTIRSERPFRFDRHFPVPAEIRPEVTFDLPGGAAELTIFANDILLPVVQAIDVTPIELSTGPSYLEAGVRVPPVEAFFLDDHAETAATSFTVRKGVPARVALSTDPGAPGITVHLHNGGGLTFVTFYAESYQQSLTLQAGEERAIALPVPDTTGVLRVQILASSKDGGGAVRIDLR